TELRQDAKIVVKRVEIEKKTVTEKVKFKTIEKDDTTMAEGKTKVLKEGKNGKDKVTYEITYIDGKEAKKKELSRKVIEKPVNKVVANGTQIEYDGKLYSRKLVVKAYSYTGGGTTASGTRARVGEIAVDPRVIPLGTNVYIEGVGPRRAEDTGGNIKGNTIDIYMNTLSECRQWGVRYVTIYIE
ncbi:MAG: G5 domain-containing protein, partial [Firmicutes bacterium]|nr:G5 domain-containing protein [Bacillota bacterium]